MSNDKEMWRLGRKICHEKRINYKVYIGYRLADELNRMYPYPIYTPYAYTIFKADKPWYRNWEHTGFQAREISPYVIKLKNGNTKDKQRCKQTAPSAG